MAEVTENTINDLVASYLRSRGIHTNSQLSTNIGGDRRQPDFELLNDVILYGEGEWNRSYAKGLTQAIEFGDIPGSSGYFLIGYPDALKKQVAKRRLKGEITLVISGKTRKTASLS